MSAETAKSSNIVTEDLVTNVFKELSSSGFLEQLRLECVTNVKTMGTYLQLKKRFVELLNKKLSNADWKFEMAAPRLNILREQIVECSVLAVTIERVVDEVVSWKLREQIVPIIKEILCACYDHKTVGKLKLDGLTKLDGGNPKFEQLEEVIKKICNHIHVDWKNVFKDGAIGKSLASVSFSTSVSQHSDEECSSSDESGGSAADSDIEIISDDEAKRNRRKRKIEITVEEEEEETRSKRERKKNSKYFSDIYDTPTILSETLKLSTPEPPKASLSPICDTPTKRKETVVSPNISIKKNTKVDKTVKPLKLICSPMKSSDQLNSSNKKWSTLNNNCVVKSEPVKENIPTMSSKSHKSSPKSKTNDESKNDDKNGFVRKSVRTHKPNSRLFWEPGDSLQKIRQLNAEREAEQDLKQMELNIQNELKREIAEVSSNQRYNNTSHKKNLSPYKKSSTPQKEDRKEKESNRSPPEVFARKSTVEHKPLINGKPKRGRPRKDCM